MAAARTAANELAKSDAHAPLHGIPIALKDIFGVAGVRMTAGSKILSENVASEDAEATARLKAAGAVVLGKLNLHEFAFGATGVNPHYGAARNPWDLERITGGSSSGSGASVAAGECAAALGLLGEMGADLTEADVPLISEIPGGVTAIMLPEALAYHQKWMSERPDDYGDDVRYRLELGATFLAVHYVQAQRFREMAVAAWREEVFPKVDLIVTPTTPITARPIEEGDLQVTFNLIRFTNPLNFLGVPAISIPCGFTGEGLPVGLQLVGRWWDEASVLRAAYAYEQATDWHERRAPI